ncbi:MAG: SulP family inorganic anion transporter [Clostridia bacterium]|nr:SulP family inorganic anion transporter [Clostridia bacterium]
MYGFLFASFASLLGNKDAQKKIMPAYAAFLILMFAAHSYGLATVSLACFICGIISIIFYFLPKQFKTHDNPVTAGIMLSTAISVTVMLTTHYFGIGASGNTVREMIASYLSLGFHPNWRGVLYGTVVMVIMITFPRKFKKLCTYLKAPFTAVIVTVILNLFLNPSDFKTAINEIGSIYIFDKSTERIFFFSDGEINFFAAIACGIALFFVCSFALQKKNADNSDCRLSAMINTVFGTSLGLLLPYGTKRKNNKWISSIGSFVLCLVVLLIPSVERIPLHSLAVVMIVGVWESIEWKEIKKAFSSPVSVIFFVLSFASILYFGYVYGILISDILYIIYVCFQKTNAFKTNE